MFITSLIHNLLSAVHNPNRMPLLKVVGDGRMRSAQLEDVKADVLPRFPYRANIESMAEVPSRWPERTVDISEIGDRDPLSAGRHCSGSCSRASAATQRRSRSASSIIRANGCSTCRCSTELCGMVARDAAGVAAGHARRDRARFSRRAQRAFRTRPTPASRPRANCMIVYRGMLLEARDEHGLSYLQPGRFVCPGSLGEVPYLWFAPLDLPDELVRLKSGTLGALMAERFEIYKREVVETFYRDYFRQYGRQIVLVDVLGALLAGRDAFEDTRLAIAAILESFRYGQRQHPVPF